MGIVGTTVTSTEAPAASANPFNTANAFIIGVGDWGSSTAAIKCQSIADVQNAVGPRSGTNSTLYDACDAYFHEGGSTAYVGRVIGTGATSASLVIQDNSAATALTVTAQYPGAYGTQIRVAVQNNTSSVVITLSDTYGNTLAVSPSLASNAAAVTWFATTGYATAVAGAGTLPATLAATALSGGANGTTTGLTQWQNALNSFGSSLGPGQVLAPGQTQTNLAGIWNALGTHALANNRVAICDMDDAVSAATLVSDIGTTYNNPAVGPMGFWAGNQLIPGVVPFTSRTVAPSAIIAGLCARADSTGNPNLAAAGSSFPLQYVTGPATLVSGTLETYNQTDLNTLNGAGINTFANKFGVLENYGFVSSTLPTTDAIYWQFNHQRMRMALQADAQVLGEQFVFSQIDGQGSDILAFNTALAGRLTSYWRIGALYGSTATQAFAVNTGPTVNTPAKLQSGQLSAVVSVRMSPHAQQVNITLNAVAITQNVPVVTP